MSDRRNDLTEHDQVLEEGQLEMIERLRVLWDNTRNPIYVWRAIDHCTCIGALRERGRTGKMPTPPFTDPYPLPDWCLGYLALVACRITVLADGKDFRFFPLPLGKVDPTAGAWQKADDQPFGAMSGAKAIDLLPAALEFAQKGSNSFDKASSLFAKELDALAFEDLKMQMGSSRNAMTALLSEAGFADERSMRKRLADADRANKPARPKIPRVKPRG